LPGQLFAERRGGMTREQFANLAELQQRSPFGMAMLK
jgi:hypothetical protein